MQSRPPDPDGKLERERLLARYFNVSSIKGDTRPLVKRYLLGAAWSAILTPALFYLKFGTINWFSISFTIFLVVLNLLFALGLYFQTRTEYHTRVPMDSSIADTIGAWWLVSCAFGPFFGWIITAFPPTLSSWKWQYLARAFLSVILPVITGVPLVPYARGKAALIAIPLLVAITALPVLSCVWVLADLHEGHQMVSVQVISRGDNAAPVCRGLDQDIPNPPCAELQPEREGQRFIVFWLPHTRRVLAKPLIKG
jgi:hypothetical protein